MTLLALRAQSKLELLRFLRNGRALFFTLLVPIGYYLIFSYGFGNTHDLQLHFGIAMAGFGTIGVSLGTLGSRLAQERQLGWLRLLQTTPLSPLAYFAAKVLATFSMAGLTIICVLTVALLEGLRVVLGPGGLGAPTLGWLTAFHCAGFCHRLLDGCRDGLYSQYRRLSRAGISGGLVATTPAHARRAAGRGSLSPFSTLLAAGAAPLAGSLLWLSP